MESERLDIMEDKIDKIALENYELDIRLIKVEGRLKNDGRK